MFGANVYKGVASLSKVERLAIGFLTKWCFFKWQKNSKGWTDNQNILTKHEGNGTKQAGPSNTDAKTRVIGSYEVTVWRGLRSLSYLEVIQPVSNWIRALKLQCSPLVEAISYEPHFGITLQDIYIASIVNKTVTRYDLISGCITIRIGQWVHCHLPFGVAASYPSSLQEVNAFVPITIPSYHYEWLGAVLIICINPFIRNSRRLPPPYGGSWPAYSLNHSWFVI